MKLIKHITALGIGLIITGTTLASASLSTWPTPFIQQGTPADNLAIIIGDEAAASDVAGAIDIGITLQAAAVIKEPLTHTQQGLTVEGDAVSISSQSDILELNETLGSVRETLTEVDLDMLKGGQIVTDEGATEYNQYLRFSTTGPAGKPIFAEDERDRIGHYLFWEDGEMVFEWHLEFEEGLETAIEKGKLVDLEDEDVFILGQPFVIVDADLVLTQANATVFGATDLTIKLMGGAISAILGENERQTYVIDGKDYDVEVLIISETTKKGEGSVKFRINGEITDELADSETDLLSNGLTIGIRDILPTGKDIQKSVAQFYLGAYTLEFRDTNTSDDLNQSAGVVVNQEEVEDSTLIIKAKILSAIQGTNSENIKPTLFELQHIKYRLFADAVLGDIFVPPGGGVREQLDEPEGMLTPAWDIVYQGITDTGVTNIVFDPAGDDEYDLQFTNQEGIFYDFPLLSTENTQTGLKYGDDDDDLWFCESSNTSAKWVTDDDFFIVSNCDNATDDNTCFTHILRYDNFDPTGNTATFTDLGTGTRDVPIQNTTRQGNLIVGGATYALFIDNAQPHNLSIDLKGDGQVDADCIELGIQGEGLLKLGNNNTNETSSQGPKAVPTIFDEVITGAITSVNITLFTLAKERDEAQNDEAIDISIQAQTTTTSLGVYNNKQPPIGLNDKRLAPRLSELFGPLDLEENEQLEQALSAYGVFFEILDPPDRTSPEALSIEYPLTQRRTEVFVTGGAVHITPTTTTTERPNHLHPLISKLASEITDLTDWNAVIIGGPCANTITTQLLNNPQPCWEAIPKNKAIIRLYEQGKNTALLIAGRTAEDTRRAAKAVAAGKLNSIQGNSAEVTGTSITDATIQEV